MRVILTITKTISTDVQTHSINELVILKVLSSLVGSDKSIVQNGGRLLERHQNLNLRVK